VNGIRWAAAPRSLQFHLREKLEEPDRHSSRRRV